MDYITSFYFNAVRSITNFYELNGGKKRVLVRKIREPESEERAIDVYDKFESYFKRNFTRLSEVEVLRALKEILEFCDLIGAPKPRPSAVMKNLISKSGYGSRYDKKVRLREALLKKQNK